MEYRKKIFNYDDDEFKEHFTNSKNYNDIVRFIFNDEQLDNSTIQYIKNSYKNDILKKIKKLELDTTHLRKEPTNNFDLNKKLVENKKYGSNRLKKQLYKEQLKLEKCEKCGTDDIWIGAPLVHQLDHINGNNKDNRIENLQILCPSCHSQTNTYSTGQGENYDVKKKIFKYDNDKFKKIIAKSKSCTNAVSLIFDEVTDNSIIRSISHRYRYDLLKKIKKLKLDISHFRKEQTKKIDLRKVLVENSKINVTILKNILYREKIKEEICEKCGTGDIWLELPLTLQLDHINGNNKDNRIENIRILCPNCHSQTSTYCVRKGNKDIFRPSKEKLLEDIKQFKTIILISEKNNVCFKTMRSWIQEDGLYEIYEEIYKSSIEPKSKKEYKCSKCNMEITENNKTGLCNGCKTKRPSKEQLLKDLAELKTHRVIGLKYGVRENCIGKWKKKYEITNFKSILLNFMARQKKN